MNLRRLRYKTSPREATKKNKTKRILIILLMQKEEEKNRQVRESSCAVFGQARNVYAHEYRSPSDSISIYAIWNAYGEPPSILGVVGVRAASMPSFKLHELNSFFRARTRSKWPTTTTKLSALVCDDVNQMRMVRWNLCASTKMVNNWAKSKDHAQAIQINNGSERKKEKKEPPPLN